MNIEAWKKANRAPLTKKALNRWVFVVSRDFAATDADIERAVRGTLGRLESGAATDVKLLKTSAVRINPAKRVIGREDLPTIPMVKSGPVTWAAVEFAWRSATPNVPWPAEAFRAGLLPVTDPEAADIMLDAVGQPSGEVPEQSSPIGKAIDHLVDDAVKTPQRAFVTGLLVLVGVGYAVSKLKK